MGNHGMQRAMSELTRQHLKTFWLLVDDTLNALLFLLIGLEIAAIDLAWRALAATAVMIPVALSGTDQTDGSRPVLFIAAAQNGGPGRKLDHRRPWMPALSRMTPKQRVSSVRAVPLSGPLAQRHGVGAAAQSASAGAVWLVLGVDLGRAARRHLGGSGTGVTADNL